MDCFRQGHFLLEEIGVFQADFLTGAYQVIPVWLKFTFLVEAKTAIRLGIQSRFADVGLSTRDFIWDLLIFKNKY